MSIRFRRARRSGEARAVQATNCFALDLYEHLQHEEGNLFFMGQVSDPTQTDNSLAPSVMQTLGDSNGDGLFDQLDIAAVLQSGKYLTGETR